MVAHPDWKDEQFAYSPAVQLFSNPVDRLDGHESMCWTGYGSLFRGLDGVRGSGGWNRSW